jgi:hypothetical protein
LFCPKLYKERNMFGLKKKCACAKPAAAKPAAKK